MGLYKMPYTNKSREEKTSSWQETVSCEVSPMDICFSNCCGFQGCISFVTHLISFPRLPHSCWRSNRLGVFPAFNLNTLVVHYNLKSKNKKNKRVTILMSKTKSDILSTHYSATRECHDWYNQMIALVSSTTWNDSRTWYIKESHDKTYVASLWYGFGQIDHVTSIPANGLPNIYYMVF